MTREFISYNQALALKELGFDEPCFASWTYKTKERIPTLYGCGALLFDTDGLITNQTENIICSAPLYQQAFRWFREKHGLYSSIFFEDDTQYYFQFNDTDSIVTLNTGHKTYEEAEQACLNKLIEIVKNR